MLQVFESVVETLLTGAQSLREFTYPYALGSLTRIDIVSDTVAGVGGAIFDLLLNGATIFPGGGGRPSMAAGASSVSVTGLATALVRNDKLRLTCASATSVGAKLYLMLTIEDGVATATPVPPSALLSRVTNAPPVSPLEGDTYYVPAGSSGTWATHTTKIATYTSGAWVYTDPVPERIYYIEDEQRRLIYKTRNVASPSNVTWVLSGFSVDGANTITKTAADFWTTAEGHSAESSATSVWRAEFTVPVASTDVANNIWSVRKNGTDNTDNNSPTWAFQGSIVGGVPKVNIHEVNGASWSYDGSSVGEYFTVANGNILAIESDGVNIKYYVGGVLVKTTAHVIASPAHLAFQCYFNGQKCYGAKFYNGTPTAISAFETVKERVADILPPTDAPSDLMILVYSASLGRLIWQTISAQVLTGAVEEDIAWSNITGHVNVAAANMLQSTSDWDAVTHNGAQATQRLEGIGAYVKVKIQAASASTRYIGLRNSAPDHNSNNIDPYRLQLRLDGAIDIVENDTLALHYTTGFVDGDIIEYFIDTNGATPAVPVLKVRKNGAVIHTYATTPTLPLYVDVELPFGGATYREGKIKRYA